MTPMHRVVFPEKVETKLIEECVRRGLGSVEELIPVIVEEYFRMWADLEGGAALLKADDSE